MWINDTQVAAVDLTTNDPDNVVTLSGNVVPASDPVVLTIKNGSGVKIGNDFSLDNICRSRPADASARSLRRSSPLLRRRVTPTVASRASWTRCSRSTVVTTR